MAVPGPVGSVASDGVHQLIRAGLATMMTRAHEVIEDPGAHLQARHAGGLDESYVPVRSPPQPSAGPDIRGGTDAGSISRTLIASSCGYDRGCVAGGT